MTYQTIHTISKNICSSLVWSSIGFHEEEKFVVPMLYPPKKRKAPPSLEVPCLKGWAHLGLNQGPPDYESGAL
ncbi:MAG: hypothetical protein N4A46_07460, partial [Schleiferiaceae bacterium]|nr:hypothetical protein [Schleiferiaceae bacterium]